ncbi:hypothetical protein OUZ56_026980 [Daphnia magna]|uniref:Uncharacterized protein n=1 Tax=Daphnia magna TaxID=35525 RepID=A0ABQ9ZNF3_9CRUS|nr:hypothetical protein OUZ56_026980 [Daphnia magna]
MKARAIVYEMQKAIHFLLIPAGPNIATNPLQSLSFRDKNKRPIMAFTSSLKFELARMREAWGYSQPQKSYHQWMAALCIKPTTFPLSPLHFP